MLIPGSSKVQTTFPNFLEISILLYYASCLSKIFKVNQPEIGSLCHHLQIMFKSIIVRFGFVETQWMADRPEDITDHPESGDRCQAPIPSTTTGYTIPAGCRAPDTITIKSEGTKMCRILYFENTQKNSKTNKMKIQFDLPKQLELLLASFWAGSHHHHHLLHD